MSHSTKLFSVYGVCLENLPLAQVAKLIGKTQLEMGDAYLGDFQSHFEKAAEALPEFRGHKGIFLQIEDEYYFGYGFIEKAYGENIVCCHADTYETSVVEPDLKIRVRQAFDDPRLAVFLYYGVTTF